MPRGPRLDALPRFVRKLRPASPTPSGSSRPSAAAGAGPSTGVLHHVRIYKAKGRGGSVAGGVEEVDVVDNGVYCKGSWLRRSELTARVPPAPQAGRMAAGFGT